VDFGAVERTLREAVDGGACPGAVILVSHAGRTVYHQAFGARTLEVEGAPMQLDTIFDLSSLTKPLATAFAVMLNVQEGKLQLDDRVTRFLHNFGVHGKVHVTIRHLLAHCSGLAAWRPYYKEILKLERQGRLHFVASRGAKEFVYEQLNRERAEYETGARALYSDLGFMVLGEVVELLAHQPLDRLCRDRIFRPLGMRATGFVDLAELRTRKVTPVTDVIAATEHCPWREKVLCGEVHDDNAYAMGGVAGHAGLFSNAADVDVLVRHLRACWRGEDGLVSRDIVRHFWTRDGTVRDSTWALGWDTPTPGTSTAGRHIGADAVGHLGFTGTSVWIDLERDAHVILFTNRVHPRRDNDGLRAVRPAVHDAVLEALDACA
jgi:CubicO group peptidase (beta-lactamase class C family)